MKNIKEYINNFDKNNTNQQINDLVDGDIIPFRL